LGGWGVESGALKTPHLGGWGVESVALKAPHLGGWGVEIGDLTIDIQDLESEPE